MRHVMRLSKLVHHVQLPVPSHVRRRIHVSCEEEDTCIMYSHLYPLIGAGNSFLNSKDLHISVLVILQVSEKARVQGNTY
jgi:hypothetical protein